MSDPAATYFAEFLSSAETLIERLAGDLEALAHDQTASGEVLRALLRGFHSLKGNSSFVPDCPLTPLADAAEGAVAAAQDGRIASESLVAPLGEVIACLRLLVAEHLEFGPILPAEKRGLEIEARLRGLARTGGGSEPVRYSYAGEDVTDLLEILVECGNRPAAGGTGDDHGERMGAAVARLHRLAAAEGASAGLWAAAANGPEALLRWLAPLIKRESSKSTGTPSAQLSALPSTPAGGADVPAAEVPGAEAERAADPDAGTPANAGTPADAGPSPRADTMIVATALLSEWEPKATRATAAGPAPPGPRPPDPPSGAYLVPRRFQVDADAVDGFLDYVGELRVIADRLEHLNNGLRLQHMPFGVEPERRRAWEHFASDFRTLRQEFDTLASRLQRSLLDIRQVPVKPLLVRHADLVRRLGQQLGKDVDAVIEGGETSVDKSVIEQLESPLTHIVRNAVDHGLESPEARVDAGKAKCGTITLRTAKQGEYFKLEVVDDGRGINIEALRRAAVERGLLSQDEASTMHVSELLFRSGLTSRKVVTEVSGRGVGLDVVKTAVRQLGGVLDLASSPGRGTRLTIKVRSTGLSSVPCVPVRIGSYHFFIPHDAALAWFADEAHGEAGASDVRLLDLASFLADSPAGDGQEIDDGPKGDRPLSTGNSLIVALAGGGETFHLQVDEAGQRIDLVAQPLDQRLLHAPIWSMATVGGDQSINLILDVDGLAGSSRADASPAARVVSPPLFADWAESGTAAVLVLETGDKRFAIDATFVDEILTSRPVTPVPGTRAPVRGLVRSRSRLVPVLDCRFMLDGKSSQGDGVIVVTRVPEGSARRWIALEAERVAGARSRNDGDEGSSELPPLLDLRRLLDVEGR